VISVRRAGIPVATAAGSLAMSPLRRVAHRTGMTDESLILAGVADDTDRTLREVQHTKADRAQQQP
jgi:hypothetical protein